ncbi:MAG: hypothetical protein FWE87_01385 [Coriobacteriia bacterium]|nr:hypothetical protein [Coriobacteriia bacterium]
MYDMRLSWSPFIADTSSVSNSHCVSCHKAEEYARIVDARGIRIDHEVCTSGLRCVVCHSGVGHELIDSWTSQYSMNQCLRCHVSRNVYSEDGCEQCHSGRFQPLSQAARSSFSLVHGANWQNTHGLGDVGTCGACHDNTMCGRCHGDLVPHDSRIIVSQHGSVAKDEQNRCGTCHREQAFCDGCHGIEMPHPDGFLNEHSAITRQVSQEVCDKCHLDDDCSACHSAHIHPGGATF